MRAFYWVVTETSERVQSKSIVMNYLNLKKNVSIFNGSGEMKHKRCEIRAKIGLEAET